MTGGVESNRSNTINGACLDGNSGTFHSDESVDRLSIASTSGNPLTHGTGATVTATVWAWNTGASDSIDFYYAANAANPVWVLIATVVPSGGGAQIISRSFTLPSGTVQAVRANYRYQGAASSCTAGAYNDHDDLIFAVN
jgi:leucyl aminopeptidase